MAQVEIRKLAQREKPVLAPIGMCKPGYSDLIFECDGK